MKKKIASLIVIVLLLSLALVGCGGGGGDTQADADNEGKETTYKIRLSHVLPESHATHIALRDAFKKYVEEKSEGRITVELYPNAQLGGDRQAIESVQLGTHEMTCPAAAPLSGFEPKFQVFDLPFLFKSREAAYKALDGELGNKLNEMLVGSGLKNLAYPQNGFRHVSNNRGPIEKPEDLKGLKIRTMENPVHMATFKALGANPTPISFGELYTALQQGTVDAQENPPAIVATSKFYEVQKYYSLTGHVYAAACLLINEDFFASLPEDLQKIVEEGALNFKDEQRRLLNEQDAELLAKLEEEGMEINELTPEQKEKFIEATKSVYDEFKDVIGEDLIELARKANE